MVSRLTRKLAAAERRTLDDTDNILTVLSVRAFYVEWVKPDVTTRLETKFSISTCNTTGGQQKIIGPPTILQTFELHTYSYNNDNVITKYIMTTDKNSCCLSVYFRQQNKTYYENFFEIEHSWPGLLRILLPYLYASFSILFLKSSLSIHAGNHAENFSGLSKRCKQYATLSVL